MRHRDLAVNAARRYAATPHAADVRQVADVALWLAARRYRPERGPFERFAVVTISGEVKRYLRGAGWAVHVSRSRQEDVLRLARVVDELTVGLGATPTIDDVARRTGWSIERVTDAFRCEAARYARPETVVAHPHAELPDLDLALIIDGLPEAERLILRLTYELEMTQREIGLLLDLTQSTVHRRLRSALARLREILRPDLSASVAGAVPAG